MSESVTVIGATGKLGLVVVNKFLYSGYHIKAAVRNPDSKMLPSHAQLSVLACDATNYDMVAGAISGSTVVISCLGNNSGKPIMEQAFSNILAASRAQDKIPRCFFTTSLGLGGSAPPVKMMLSLVIGKKLMDDLEQADSLVRSQEDVPYVLTRPARLKDGPGKGRFHIIEKEQVLSARSIDREDVAQFYLDCMTDQSFDYSSVLIEGV